MNTLDNDGCTNRVESNGDAGHSPAIYCTAKRTGRLSGPALPRLERGRSVAPGENARHFRHAQMPNGTMPYSAAAAAVYDFGKAFNGKVVIDITNPVAPDLSGLVTPSGTSGAQETAKGVPAGAHVVKAFNTLFGHVLARGGRLDAFIAADDADAKERVAAYLNSIGLRPMDVGPLQMAQTLESLGLLMIGLAKNGAGTFDIALRVDIG